MSYWTRLRFVVVLGVCSVLVAALARAPLEPEVRLFVLVTIAGVAAWSARSGLLLLAARTERIVLDTGAPTHRLAVVAGVAALLALGAAAVLSFAPLPDRVAIVVAGVAGAVIGALLSTRDGRPKGPRRSSRVAWLLFDTALPAGVMAALVSVAIGIARLHGQDTVAATEIARHLAVTTFAYAVFLGLGGFAKAFGEKKSGLVVVHAKQTNSPGPIFVGGVAGVLLLFIGPQALPTLPLLDVLVVKATVGLVAGAALSLLGALQGARAAEQARPYQRSG